jgi:hypothetical protein
VVRCAGGFPRHLSLLGVTMPTYRLTIERGVRFQLDVEAADRKDALQKITVTALVYDAQDQKETRVIAIQELKEVDVLNSLD